MPTTLEQLTEYHRAKVMAQAGEWRMKNHPKVLELLKGCNDPAKPVGAVIFDPERWDGQNWLWFQGELIKILERKMR